MVARLPAHILSEEPILTHCYVNLQLDMTEKLKLKSILLKGVTAGRKTEIQFINSKAIYVAMFLKWDEMRLVASPPLQ